VLLAAFLILPTSTGPDRAEQMHRDAEREANWMRRPSDVCLGRLVSEPRPIAIERRKRELTAASQDPANFAKHS
jgi:hypothetical protein